jgi:hypothetical protein
VLRTIATSVGELGLSVTEFGAGEQIMVGFVVVQANCTVPLKPGAAVNTSPKAIELPGVTVGTDGCPAGGGARDSVNGALLIVRTVFPLTVPCVADIVDWPPAIKVANPAALIVAAFVFEESHTTAVVMSFVLASAYVPVAWNCRVVPAGADGFAGVTAIETSAVGVTVSWAVP